MNSYSQHKFQHSLPNNTVIIIQSIILKFSSLNLQKCTHLQLSHVTAFNPRCFQPGRRKANIAHRLATTCEISSSQSTDRITNHFTILAIWPTHLATRRRHATTAHLTGLPAIQAPVTACFCGFKHKRKMAEAGLIWSKLIQDILWL